MQSICCTLTSACVRPRVSTPITLNQALLKQVASAEHSVDPGQCETDRTSTTRRWKIELHLHCWAATQDFSGQTGGVSVRSVSLEQTQHIVCSPRTADCYYTTVLFPHSTCFMHSAVHHGGPDWSISTTFGEIDWLSHLSRLVAQFPTNDFYGFHYHQVKHPLCPVHNLIPAHLNTPHRQHEHQHEHQHFHCIVCIVSKHSLAEMLTRPSALGVV